MASTTSQPSAASAPEVTANLVAALQSELVGLKAEMGTKVATLEETIANLAHENALLKRRLFGNKTERSHTSEAQLAFGDLVAAEQRLQKQLDEALAKAKAEAGIAEQQPGSPAERKKPKGRRNLLAGNLPRCQVDILDEELEAKGCRRIRGERAVDVPAWWFRRAGQACGAL